MNDQMSPVGLTIPSVLQREGNREFATDLFSRMLKERIIFVGEVNDATATVITAQLLYLEAESAEKDIHLYINSPGGSVTAGLAIYDTMQFVKPDVSTLCIGQACSMGAVLLAAGTKGKRFALPNARVMIHQPSGGSRGQATDIEIQAREILYLRERLNAILVHHSGAKLAQVAKDTERDHFMNAEKAKEYGSRGLIDQVIERR